MSSPEQLRDEDAATAAAAGPPHPIEGMAAGSPSLSENDNKAISDFDGYIYIDIEGLAAKFLEARPWSDTAMEVAQEMSGPQGPDIGSREGFAIWLRSLQAAIPPYSVLGDTPAHFTWLEERPRRSSLVLSRCVDDKDSPTWSNVLAIGEMSVDGPYQTGLRILCEHAKEVFSHQPARVLLHAFHICGDMLEMWVFDRSGLYGSKAVEVMKAPDRLVHTLASYLLMDDASLGVGDLIKNDNYGKKYIECGPDGTGGIGELCFDEPPIFARIDKTIVGDGLACYRARAPSSNDWEYAVKVKWTDPSDKSETGLLKLTAEKRVWGVIQLVYERIVCNTSDWRRGLVLGTPRRLRTVTGAVGQVSPPSAAGCTTEVSGNEDVGLATTNGKVLSCIVVTPLGESLHRFKSVSGLLYALRDAVRAHRSLYLDGGILHQDICPGNIIIPSRGVGSCGNDEAKGLLIDLDAAKPVTAPWRQFESVGTPHFQAIGVLQAYLPDNPHTYRHDLESFFYTFLFLAICRRPVPAGKNQLDLPKTSALRMWIQGRPVDKARRKTENMQAENFSNITAEFTPEFKGLCGLAEKLRGLLFPTKDGKLWTGTDQTTKGMMALYDGMIEAFDSAAELACSL